MDRIIEVKPSRPDAPTPGFTPGPWRASCGVSWSNVYDGRDNCVAHCSDSAWITDAEAAANARLIAAAPEGYHAVVGLLNAIHDSMTHESQRFHADAIDAARAYLAKAGGK